MSAIASQITGVSIVYSMAQIKDNIEAPRYWRFWPANSPHKGTVTRKMFPFDDVIMDTIMNLGPVR